MLRKPFMVRVDQIESVRGKERKSDGRDGGEERRIGKVEIGGGKVKETHRLGAQRDTVVGEEWRRSDIEEERRIGMETETKTETGTERGIEEKIEKMTKTRAGS